MILLTAWASDTMADKPEARTILFASGTVVVYICNAFLPLSWFPAVEAPVSSPSLPLLSLFKGSTTDGLVLPPTPALSLLELANRKRSSAWLDGLFDWNLPPHRVPRSKG